MAFSYIVYEDCGWQRLLPLVYLRPVFQLLCGMDDLQGKIAHLVEALANAPPAPATGTSGAAASPQAWCRPSLSSLVAETTGLATNQPIETHALLLNGRGLWRQLPTLTEDDRAWVGTVGPERQVACIYAPPDLAARLAPEILLDEVRVRTVLAGLPTHDVSHLVRLFDWPWQIVHANPEAIESDWNARLAEAGQLWDLAWQQRERVWNGDEGGGQTLSGRIDPGSHLLAPESIHIGQNTRIKPCVVIDAENGPVWIGRNVTIYPHCYVQGPAYIGDGTLLQPGAIVREGTSIGPRCKVGGEIEGSIVHGYSNKQHDGFLGHSYVGSWVNIAADCINSDLKNTYGTVRVPINGRTVETGEMFVGMFMGDYSKAGINVSFPTGAVIGFCSSVFAARSPKFVPSFAWIDGESTQRYDAHRGLAIARKVMQRRDHTMTAAEERAFLAVRQQALAVEHEPQRHLESWPVAVPSGSGRGTRANGEGRVKPHAAAPTAGVP